MTPPSGPETAGLDQRLQNPQFWTRDDSNAELPRWALTSSANSCCLGILSQTLAPSCDSIWRFAICSNHGFAGEGCGRYLTFNSLNECLSTISASLPRARTI